MIEKTPGNTKIDDQLDYQLDPSQLTNSRAARRIHQIIHFRTGLQRIKLAVHAPIHLCVMPRICGFLHDHILCGSMKAWHQVRGLKESHCDTCNQCLWGMSVETRTPVQFAAPIINGRQEQHKCMLEMS
jgi:hypothetical protein